MFWFALGFFCVVSGGLAPWQAICQSEPSLLLEAGQSVAAKYAKADALTACRLTHT